MVKRIIYASILCIILSAVVTFTAEASDLVLFREYENIPSDKEWTIVFNEKIDGNSVNENSIYILNDFGIKMDSILVVNDNTVTIKPKMLYYPDSTYHLYVMGVKGIDGQRLKEGFYVKFSTERADKIVTNKYINSYFADDYIKAEILSNARLAIEGATLGDYKYAWIRIKDAKTGIIVAEKFIDINNHRFKDELPVSLKDGDYTFNAYYGLQRYGSYETKYWNIPLICRDGLTSFPNNIIYENNIKMVNMNNDVVNADLEFYGHTDDEKTVIKELAEDITRGITDEYKKVFEISKWVSSNIYYDWDAYLLGEYGSTRAIDTLITRKSVCEGYAQLTKALMNSLGIPARVVRGHALGASAIGKSWYEVEHRDTNHAWNEVYVDGRWIIIDNTWNSNNKYINGEFIKDDNHYRYFDSTIEAFSYTHKIISR